MHTQLKKRLMLATGGGVLALAAILVQWHEGQRYKPYHDGGGVLTVCYGHTGKDVVPGQIYTEEQCDALMSQDLKTALSTVEQQVKIPLADTQKAALASFVYNIGPGAFRRSTLLKKLNVGDIPGACDELRRWKYDEGNVSQGLVNRRKVERELCLNPALLTNLSLSHHIQQKVQCPQHDRNSPISSIFGRICTKIGINDFVQAF